MKKYSISAVSYLNTKPLLFGLIQSEISNEMDISLDIPSECARKMIAGDATIGLIPVAAIPSIPGCRVITDYCIGTKNKVKTVCLFSNKPIEEITEIFLDYQSRTSVLLLKLLMEKYWKKEVIYQSTNANFQFEKDKSCLIIGDRAIEKMNDFEYVYDLGEAWHSLTGLPFVFAAWVTNVDLDPIFLTKFNEALKYGIHNLDSLALVLQSPHPDFDLIKYYKENISYELDASKKEAMKLFLEYVTH